MRHWKITLVLIVGLFGVTFREYLPEYVKLLFVLIIVGGTMWAALDNNYTSSKPKAKGVEYGN